MEPNSSPVYSTRVENLGVNSINSKTNFQVLFQVSGVFCAPNNLSLLHWGGHRRIYIVPVHKQPPNLGAFLVAPEVGNNVNIVKMKQQSSLLLGQASLDSHVWEILDCLAPPIWRSDCPDTYSLDLFALGIKKANI